MTVLTKNTDRLYINTLVEQLPVEHVQRTANSLFVRCTPEEAQNVLQETMSHKVP